MVVLLHIFSWFWQWNNFENRLIFDEVKAYTKNCAIYFGPPCILTLALPADGEAHWVCWGALKNFPCKLRLKKFPPPWGFRCTHCTPGTSMHAISLPFQSYRSLYCSNFGYFASLSHPGGLGQALQLCRWPFSHKETLYQPFFHRSAILLEKRPFCVFEPLSGLSGNVRCSSYAHWKTRSGLPISVNLTFC